MRYNTSQFARSLLDAAEAQEKAQRDALLEYQANLRQAAVAAFLAIFDIQPYGCETVGNGDTVVHQDDLAFLYTEYQGKPLFQLQLAPCHYCSMWIYSKPFATKVDAGVALRDEWSKIDTTADYRHFDCERPKMPGAERP